MWSWLHKFLRKRWRVIPLNSNRWWIRRKKILRRSDRVTCQKLKWITKLTKQLLPKGTCKVSLPLHHILTHKICRLSKPWIQSNKVLIISKPVIARSLRTSLVSILMTKRAQNLSSKLRKKTLNPIQIAVKKIRNQVKIWMKRN